MADKRDKTDSAGNAADLLEQEVRSLVDEYRHGPDESELDTEKLATLLHKLPESRCLYERGFLAQATDKTEEAIRYYQQALLLADSEKKADLYCDIASCHVDADDSDEAIEFHKKAQQADQCCVEAAQKLGDIYSKKDDWAKACSYYEKALRHADDDEKLDILVALGDSYSSLGKADKATDCFTKALKADEHSPEALRGMGHIHFEKKDYSSARECFEQAIQYASDECKPYLSYEVAQCLLELGDRDRAIDQFVQALDADEQNYMAAWFLGDLCCEDNSWKQALVYYQQAARYVDEESWPVLYFEMGQCHRELGERDLAIDQFVRCLDADPQFWAAALDLGNIYYDDKNWKQALSYYQQVARYASDEDAEDKADIYFASAVCYQKIKDHEAAIKEYEACLGLAPDYPGARNNLGLVLWRMGRYDEAVAVFREAIRRGKDGRYPLRNLATSLRRLKRYPEAIEVLKQHVARKGGLTLFAQKEMRLSLS